MLESILIEFLKYAGAAVAAAFWQEYRLRQKRLEKARSDLGSKSASTRIDAVQELIQLVVEYKSSIQRAIDFLLIKKRVNLPQRVMNILCFHIRQTTSENRYRQKSKYHPSPEVQEMLTLIFVNENNDVFEGCRINLQGSHLNGCNLSKARMKSANFIESHLRNAVFISSDLQGALFVKSQLQVAYFKKALLRGAIFIQAELQVADLEDAQLQGAELTQAQLQGTSLGGARLEGVYSRFEDETKRDSFESRIRNGIGKHSDLNGVTFSGGISQRHIDEICKELDGIYKTAFPPTLKDQVGKEAIHSLPNGCGAKSGFYSAEEAEEWIEEYNKAMKGSE